MRIDVCVTNRKASYYIDDSDHGVPFDRILGEVVMMNFGPGWTMELTVSRTYYSYNMHKYGDATSTMYSAALIKDPAKTILIR